MQGYMKIRSMIVAVSLAFTLASCGDDKGQKVTRDNTQEVLNYYAEHSDFFVFSTIEALPENLAWEDGSGLPEIGSPDAKKGGVWHERIQDFPRTLRLFGPDSNGSFRSYILDYTRPNLAQPHPDTDEFLLYPGLAKEWAVSREDKTVYVRLDPDARWSDGVPLTVDDFVFSFFFFQSSYIVAPWYNDFYGKGTIFDKITKYDDHTIGFTMAEAKPDMAYKAMSDWSPVPRHFFKELGDDYVDYYQWKYVPTPGPYILKPEDVKKGRSISLTRMDDWWGKDKKFWKYRFNPDKLHFTVIRDTPKAFEAFKRGEIDRFRINLAEYWYDKLPNDDPMVQSGYIHKTQFYNNKPRPPWGLWMNESKHLLDNQDVRVGINYATNWQLVIDQYFRGDNTRLRTGNDGYGSFSHPTLQPRPFSIEKAQEYFAKAGFTERGPDGILMNAAGERLSFSLTTGYERLKDILTILREEAGKAGVEIRVEILDATSGWKKVQEKKHDLYFVAFNSPHEMYARYWETYHSDNAYDVAFLEDGSVNPDRKIKTQTNNLQMIADLEIDRLIDLYRASEDADEMRGLAYQLEERLFEHGSFVPGYIEPFERVGHWRWMRYPDEFSYQHMRSDWQFFVHWIDEDLKAETLGAMKSGETFPAKITINDKYKEQ